MFAPHLLHPIVGGVGETVSNSYIRILYPEVSSNLLTYLPTVYLRAESLVRVFHPRAARRALSAPRAWRADGREGRRVVERKSMPSSVVACRLTARRGPRRA